MASVTMNYAASATITCGVAALASSSTFVAGRESSVVDNTSNKYADALLSGVVKTNSAATANTAILVYVFAPINDTPTYPDVMDGTDSAETLNSPGNGQAYLKLAAALNVDVTAGASYPFGPVAVAPLFGGIMPPKWSLFVTHNTDIALSTTAGDHSFSYMGIKYDVA